MFKRAPFWLASLVTLAVIMGLEIAFGPGNHLHLVWSIVPATVFALAVAFLVGLFASNDRDWGGVSVFAVIAAVAWLLPNMFHIFPGAMQAIPIAVAAAIGYVAARLFCGKTNTVAHG